MVAIIQILQTSLTLSLLKDLKEVILSVLIEVEVILVMAQVMVLLAVMVKDEQVGEMLVNDSASSVVRFDENFTPQINQSQSSSGSNQAYMIAMLTSFSGASFDQNWYLDSAATNHLTLDLNNLTEHIAYIGTDHVHMGNDQGLTIQNIGKSLFSSPFHSELLALKSLLHVPMNKKNFLISVSKFAKDNNVYFEFFPKSCFVKY